jgi:hypothetical protein
MKNFCKLLFLFGVAILASCARHNLSLPQYHQAMAEGAARVYFHDVYDKHLKANRNSSLEFSDYKLSNKKLNMDGVAFLQFTWTYSGRESLTAGKQISVYLSELDSEMWLEEGAKF